MSKDSSVKNFVLRIDASMWEAIEKWAADEFRSTNGQIQWIIADALRRSGRLKSGGRKMSAGVAKDGSGQIDDDVNKEMHEM